MTKDIAKLDVGGNRRVTTVAPCAEPLRKLDAILSCGFNDKGLSPSVVMLNVAHNNRVTTVAPFSQALKE